MKLPVISGSNNNEYPGRRRIEGLDRGVTLVEVMIVAAITIILAVLAAPIYGNLQVSTQLNEETDQIIQTIRTAREMSVARVNDAAHGVKFFSDRYVLYQGDSYNAVRDTSYDRVMILGGVLTITTTIPGSDVNFSRSLGRPNATGTVILTHQVNGVRTINVGAFGKIELQ